MSEKRMQEIIGAAQTGVFTNGQLTKIVKGFAEMLTRLQEDNEAQRLRIQFLENNHRNLLNEMQNVKQTVAFTNGRGMGSTVHKEGE